MSKSLGNSPDPLDLIDAYGADGLRFGIVSIAPQGQDIRFQEERIESGKNFCNKLWNACRFRQMSGPPGDNSSLESILGRLDAAKFDADDHAILERVLSTTREVDRFYYGYEFSAVAQALYTFFWNDFCDWYVEVSKSKLLDPGTKANCLALQDFVLRQTLVLLHPIIPFITEELWAQLGSTARVGIHRGLAARRCLAVGLRAEDTRREPRPRPLAASVESMKAFVSKGRALKAERGVASRRDVRFLVKADDASWGTIESNMAKLLRMAGAAEIVRTGDFDGIPAAVTPLGTLGLDLAALVDSGAERQRLAKELEALIKHVAGTEARLSNPAFVGKAPPAVLEGARRQLAEQKAKRAELERLLQ